MVAQFILSAHYLAWPWSATIPGRNGAATGGGVISCTIGDGLCSRGTCTPLDGGQRQRRDDHTAAVVTTATRRALVPSARAERGGGFLWLRRASHDKRVTGAGRALHTTATRRFRTDETRHNACPSVKVDEAVPHDGCSHRVREPPYRRRLLTAVSSDTCNNNNNNNGDDGADNSRRPQCENIEDHRLRRARAGLR